MQCKKCGTEIREGCLFCHNCGEAIQMVPDYEPELDDLQVKIASAQTKLPNKPTVKQLEEKTEQSIKVLKKFNWKLIFVVFLIVLGVAAFIISYGSVLKNQEPGAMKETESPQVEKEKIYISSPAFSVPGGTYTDYPTVKLTAETEGTIYYTLDGSTPNEKSYRYFDGIDLHEGTTIVRAFVMDSEGNSSEIVSEVYEVVIKAPEKPVIIPESGEYIGEHYVQIIVPQDCMAYYTLDGSNPKISSEIYTGEFLMPEGTTNVCVIVQDRYGNFSEMSYVTYICTASEESEN